MRIEKPVRIVSTGKYLPEAIPSSIIEKKFGIPEGWSEKNSGVKSRHHVTFETGGYMGARAIEKALEKASMVLSDIDLIIAASATFDYPLPSKASVIKSELKNALNINTAILDVDTTCLSFVNAFEVASKFLDGKNYRNIIIVSSEISSKGLNPDNWETLTLFGDGAAAVILSYDEKAESGFIKGGQRTYSEGVEYTMIQGGGNKYFIKDFPYDAKLHSFKMEGIKLLRLAKAKIPDFMKWFFSELSISITDIDMIIPHQASRTGLQIFRNLFDFKENQLSGNLISHGNCIAASIPMVLHDEIESGSLKRGDLCFMTGTSAGFSIGGVLIRY